MKKDINSKNVKESLLDYEQLTNTLRENSSAAIRSLLNEAVVEEYKKILSESEDEDNFEVEEVEDTNDSEGQENAIDTDMGGAEMDGGEESFGDTEDDSTSDGNEWAEFDKYKISDNEYDFSNAEDDEIVRVYKLMTNDDEVMLTKNDGNVHIKDNETGAEYIVDLGSQEESSIDGGSEETLPSPSSETSPIEGEDTEETSIGEIGGKEGSEESDTPEEDVTSVEDKTEDDDDMNESKLYEIALNEYDSNVGYTDNYQKKDVMTNSGMSEPGKQVNDWDKGVPNGTKKPFAGKTSDKGEPFNEEDEKPIEECGDQPIQEEEEIEEANLSQSRWNDTHAAHNRVPAANKDEYRRDGIQKTSKGTKYRANGASDGETTNESLKKIMTKANKIFQENKALKEALGEFKKMLNEAAVLNTNLGQIVKLFTENTTTKAEKQEIVRRFGQNVKNVNESYQLYETISRELQSKNELNINEEKQFTANSSKNVNETKIYQSKDMLDSLEMMHKICRI